jgi:hypothetical protein
MIDGDEMGRIHQLQAAITDTTFKIECLKNGRPEHRNPECPHRLDEIVAAGCCILIFRRLDVPFFLN